MHARMPVRDLYGGDELVVERGIYGGLVGSQNSGGENG